VDMKLLKLKQIKPSPYNSRKTFDEGKMKELIASVEEKGILNPILVRPLNGTAGKDGYELVCGERRFRAATAAGMEEIPAVIRTLTDQQALECMVVENLQREDVHPLEEAEGYEKLLKLQVEKKLMTIEDLSAKVGKSTSYIRGRLKLCELIPENRKFFYDGKFTPSVALLVARVPAHLQKEAGKAIVENDEWGGGPDDDPMTYAQAKEHIEENFMLQMKEASWDPKEKGLADKGSCLECPKRTGGQKELFADIQGADRCTDPGCFNAKKQAFIQRKMAELKKSGKNLLPADQVGNALRYGSNYIKLEDTCYNVSVQGKRPTYRELARKAKDAEIIYAVHPEEGKVIELITKPEAARILKKLGVKDESSDTKTRGEKVSEHKKEERVTAEKHKFYIDKIANNMDQRVKNVFILSALQERAQVDDAPFEDDLEEIYELGDDKVKVLIAKALKNMPEFTMYDDRDLDFIAAKLGFSMAKDYVITKEYLEACTKDELVKLIKEFGISFAQEGTAPKKVLVEYIFKNAPKGKVPKELLK